MKQVQIILNNGKEITFEAEDNFDMQEECTGGAIYQATDGKRYSININSIAVIITTPMEQCKNCGKWMVPDQAKTERATLSGKTTTIEYYCPYCGYPDDKTFKAERDYVKSNG